MSKTPISFEDNTKKSERKRRTGRGFFTALALCLIAIGGVAASTFSETVNHPMTDTSATTTVPTVRTTEIPAAAPTVASTVTTSTVATTEATTAPTEPPALTALPLNGAILTPFSERPLYNKTMADYRAHTALDLGGEEGHSVMVIAEGPRCIRYGSAGRSRGRRQCYRKTGSNTVGSASRPSPAPGALSSGNSG